MPIPVEEPGDEARGRAQASFAERLDDLNAFVQEYGRRPRRSLDRDARERRLAGFCEQMRPQAQRDAIRSVLSDVPAVVPPQNQSPGSLEARIERQRRVIESAGFIPSPLPAAPAERSLDQWKREAQDAVARRKQLREEAGKLRGQVTERRLVQLRDFLRTEGRPPSSSARVSDEERALQRWISSFRRSSPTARKAAQVIQDEIGSQQDGAFRRKSPVTLQRFVELRDFLRTEGRLPKGVKGSGARERSLAGWLRNGVRRDSLVRELGLLVEEELGVPLAVASRGHSVPTQRRLAQYRDFLRAEGRIPRMVRRDDVECALAIWRWHAQRRPEINNEIEQIIQSELTL